MAAMSPIPEFRFISGITLHVEQHGDEAPQILTFMKEKAKEVTIGRKSTQPKNSSEPGDELALFRCPVISRRHAKITFTETGDVYITDLKSHHGTYVLKASDTLSTTVHPDKHCYLSDGDIITLGKIVGREETLVRPVIAQVHLIWSSLPLGTTPISPVSSSSPVGPTPVPRGTSTGRYGLSSASSYSISSSSSEAESDVEEVEPYSFPPYPPSHCGFVPQPSVLYPQRLGLLRRSFLPRIHSVDEAEQTASNRYSPIEVSSASPSRSPSIVELQPPQQSQPEGNVIGAWPASGASDQPSSSLEEDPMSMFFSIEMPSEPIASAVEAASNNVPDVVEAEVQVADQLMTLQSFVSVMQVDGSDTSDSFERRIEQLKSRLADLDERLTEEDEKGNEQDPDVVPTSDPELDTVSDVQEKEHGGAIMPTEDHQLSQIKSVVDVAIKELRATIEAERAQEQEILKAKLAEAEALVAETRAIASKQAVLQAQSNAVVNASSEMTVSAPTAVKDATLKRKRDEMDEEPEAISTSALDAMNIHHCCAAAIVDDLTGGRPAKRRRSKAMRFVSGVAKTTVIAAMGAVATWSALAFT